MLGNVWEWTCSQYKKSYDGSEQKCAVSAGWYSLRTYARAMLTDGVLNCSIMYCESMPCLI